MTKPIQDNTTEAFSFLGVTWNVTALKEAIKVANMTPKMIETERFKNYPLNIIRLNDEVVANADVTDPIIYCHLGGTSGGIVVDGNHRLKRALDEGIPEIPVYWLTPFEHRGFVTDSYMEEMLQRTYEMGTKA